MSEGGDDLFGAASEDGGTPTEVDRSNDEPTKQLPYQARPRDPALLCAAHRTNGQPCANYRMQGTTVCRKHGGGAPQVRAKAKVRILEAADIAAKQLIHFMTSSDVPYPTRLAAARDLLDRAGLAATQHVEVEAGEKPWVVVLGRIEDDIRNGVAAPMPTDDDDADADDDGLVRYAEVFPDPADASAVDLDRAEDVADRHMPRGVGGNVRHLPARTFAARAATRRLPGAMFDDRADPADSDEPDGA